MPRRVLLLLSVVALIACTGDSTEPNTTDASADGPRLTIEGRAFGVAPTLSAGESMTIVNLDSVRHTFSSGDESWDAVEIAGDSEADFVVPDGLAPGTYTFFCEVHSDMGGTLTIGE